MDHIMTFLAMCLLCRLCDSEEAFISGFQWIRSIERLCQAISNNSIDESKLQTLQSLTVNSC